LIPKEREVVVRRGQLIVLDGLFAPDQPYGPRPDETIERVLTRFRSPGCVPCSAAVRSRAARCRRSSRRRMRVRTSERVTRVIDHDVDSSMERKESEGYF
jgi:sulfate adenylyltransferase subunit 2